MFTSKTEIQLKHNERELLRTSGAQNNLNESCVHKRGGECLGKCTNHYYFIL